MELENESLCLHDATIKLIAYHNGNCHTVCTPVILLSSSLPIVLIVWRPYSSFTINFHCPELHQFCHNGCISLGDRWTDRRTATCMFYLYLGLCLHVGHHIFYSSYNSEFTDEEGALFSFNYFFYNKRLKRILFFTCQGCR